MLTKNIFRKEIKEILLDYMREGKILPGSRISLPQFAKELDVSVTPIREALTQLTETRIVTYLANRGFFVTELKQSEAREIYELIALLECEAIRNSKFTKKQFQELRQINKTLRKVTDPTAKLQLDMQFHKKLIENYMNQYSKKILEDIRIRIFIYEYEFMSSEPIDESAKMHDSILNHLEAGNNEKAIIELKSNWDISINHIISMYQSREA